MIHWHCHDNHSHMPPGATNAAIAVVIDVLRASTTIITALAHGADRVVPVAGVEDARRLAALPCSTGQPGSTTLLGGERGGERIDGFDLGNSPLEYTADRVRGRTVVITTTNGTAALHACRDAREILVGGIVNRRAVADTLRRLATDGEHVHLVCAGTDGAVSSEDVLAAGAILDAATAEGHDDVLDAPAKEALAFFRRVAARGDVRDASDVPAALVAEFRNSPGGVNLVALGMEADLPVAAAIDSLPHVPRLDHTTGHLTLIEKPAT